MSELRWNEALQEITKVEYKYNIKNPLWDTEGWEGVFKEYGFVPVDAKGTWWTRIPDAPEIPIICAPLVTNSVTTSGSVIGTSATGLIETATPILDVTYTEVAGGTAATVTTGGAVTSISSAVATAAAGAAIGFGVGVGSFELFPEFWTNISNAVFGTDLDPTEIAKMTEDTNALAIIKDGIVYMAEDMIDAIRNAFFDNDAGGGIPELISNCTYSMVQTITDTAPNSTNSVITTNVNGSFDGSYNLCYLPYKETDMGTLYQLYRYYNSNFSIFNYYGLSGTSTRVNRNNSTGEIVSTTTNPKNDCNQIIGKPTSYTSGTVTQTIVSVSTNIPIFDSQEAALRYFTTGDNSGQVNKPDSPNSPVTPSGNVGTKDDSISTLFPEWQNKAIQTVAGDGKTKVNWLPVSIPNSNPYVNGIPFTTEESQTGKLPDDDTETLNQIADNTQEITTDAPVNPTPPIPPEPIITPTPNSPVLVGAASIGLANLYNPTLAQLKEFSRWLWGTDFDLEQLKKLFQDPMQAIIGLHVLYATPTTGSEKGIQLGYINSGVNSKTVTKQYIDIDCGTVAINEYFGDARDYSPFTQVFCYLPFIGIVELNADDAISSNLTIKYRIDVLTGCCLAELKVEKFGVDAVLYTYTGNCAVQMPITSGSYLSTITSLLGAVVGVVGGALTGGVAGAVAGGVYGASHIQKASVSMSGSLGSNAGAMGIRKPYIIIKRVEEADAKEYNKFYGYPTNKRVLLSDLKGYVRVKDINLSGVSATAEEKEEIVKLLKEGIII